MMATNFRSVECEPWLECRSSPKSFLTGECDPVLFYSPHYEQALLDEFLPGSPTRSEFLSDFNSESDTGRSSSLETPDGDFDFEPSSSGERVAYPLAVLSPVVSSISSDEIACAQFPTGTVPSVLESAEQSPPRDQKTAEVKRETLKPSPSKIGQRKQRRGRPSGSNSNSKMAVYAKNYREQKKQETRILAARVRELEEENNRLRLESRSWKEKFLVLSTQIDDMKKSSERSSKVSAVIDMMSAHSIGGVRLTFDQYGEPCFEFSN